jgi:hypothetical protein
VQLDLVADGLHRVALDGHGVDLLGARPAGDVARVAQRLLGRVGADDLVGLVAERALGLALVAPAADRARSYAQTMSSLAPVSAAI